MTAGIKANVDGSAAIQVGGTDVIGLSSTGNINFPISGQRITGDFSNATIANRVMFQTSTVNGVTSVSAVNNGTGTGANFSAYAQSDPNNSSRAQFAVVPTTDTRISSDITGTGTYLPMTFYTSASERMRIDTSGNVGIGTSSPSSVGKVAIANSGADVRQVMVADDNNAYDATIAFLRTGVTIWNAGVDQADSNKFKISNSGTYDISSGNVLTITGFGAGGNVGIGTASPGYKLHVVGLARIGDNVYDTGSIELNNLGTGDRNTYLDFHCAGTPGSLDFSGRIIRTSGFNGNFEMLNTGTGAVRVIANTGGVTLTNGATAWAAISDERFKTDLTQITNAVAKITSVRAVTGRYKTDEEGVSRSFLIAQDVKAVLPEAVSESDDEDKTLTLRYTETIPLLVAAIQELKAELDALKGI